MSYQDLRQQQGAVIDADSYETELSQQFSVIDRHSSFDGAFKADRDLRIDGQVKGSIVCQGTLLVAQGAVVDAKIEAENIDIAGQLTGEIHCKGLLRLLPSGRLSGQVFTSQLVVNDGAVYEGNLEMKAPASRQQQMRPAAMLTSQQLINEAAAASSGASQGGDSPSTYVRRLGGQETPWSPDDEVEAANGNGKLS